MPHFAAGLADDIARIRTAQDHVLTALGTVLHFANSARWLTSPPNTANCTPTSN
jgi:hypothetical protein